MAPWWNGRHCRFKICCSKERPGSSPGGATELNKHLLSLAVLLNLDVSKCKSDNKVFDSLCLELNSMLYKESQRLKTNEKLRDLVSKYLNCLNTGERYVDIIENYIKTQLCSRGGMADAVDSKSTVRKDVSVQVRP
jgi:hypothetical protein